MSRISTERAVAAEKAERVSEDTIRQLGFDPFGMPTLTKADAYEFAHGINPYISENSWQRSVARGELACIVKNRRKFFSRAEVIAWLQRSDSHRDENVRMK
ncbi:hypothetical protein [Rhodococcus sp. NPDC058521]|uniref:hypothetical protein n=1 Tax=Rhodococcus sp. NPDC058521 TaxID=3346536 RepID=UPI0036574E35